ERPCRCSKTEPRDLLSKPPASALETPAACSAPVTSAGMDVAVTFWRPLTNPFLGGLTSLRGPPQEPRHPTPGEYPMFKTGKGKVAADPGYPPLNALLYNFDIGGAVLKKEHKDWLASDAVPRLRDNAGSALLIGSASQTGGGLDNLALSLKR